MMGRDLKKSKALKTKIVKNIKSESGKKSQTDGQEFKPLKGMKFDSIGEEYVYLYETINSHVSNIKNSEEEIIKELAKSYKKGWTPSIEDLRENYNKLVSLYEVDVAIDPVGKHTEDLNEKYEKNSIYWSEAQEIAIVEFITETDEIKRNLIFSRKIYKPLKKLVENIIFTYKLFRTDVEVVELQADCMSFLITKIEKFNPNTGAKAYAYLGTIAKHYLMGEKRIAYKHTKINVNIDENIEEASEKPGYVYHLEDSEYVESDNLLFNDVIRKIEEEMKKPKMLLNDKKVAEAIVWIFRNHEMLKIYNKNLVYHMLKERTGLQTKEITYSLSRLKNFYKLFKKDFIKGLE